MKMLYLRFEKWKANTMRQEFLQRFHLIMAQLGQSLIQRASQGLREKNREEREKRVFWQHKHAPNNDDKMRGGASLLQLKRSQTHSLIKGPKHRSKLQLSSTLRSRFVDFASHPPIISKGAFSNQWSKRQIHVTMKLNPQIQGFHDSSGAPF